MDLTNEQLAVVIATAVATAMAPINQQLQELAQGRANREKEEQEQRERDDKKIMEEIRVWAKSNVNIKN